MQLALTVDDEWRVTAASIGAEVQVHFTCPSCSRSYLINLQPPPWHRPAKISESDFEVQRVSGDIRHVELDVITSELWCHPCGRGASIELRVVEPARG